MNNSHRIVGNAVAVFIDNCTKSNAVFANIFYIF